MPIDDPEDEDEGQSDHGPGQADREVREHLALAGTPRSRNSTVPRGVGMSSKTVPGPLPDEQERHARRVPRGAIRGDPSTTETAAVDEQELGHLGGQAGRDVDGGSAHESSLPAALAGSRQRNTRRSAGAIRSRSTRITKITKKNIHASRSTTEKTWNDFSSWYPTPEVAAERLRQGGQLPRVRERDASAREEERHDRWDHDAAEGPAAAPPERPAHRRRARGPPIPRRPRR